MWTRRKRAGPSVLVFYVISSGSHLVKQVTTDVPGLNIDLPLGIKERLGGGLAEFSTPCHGLRKQCSHYCTVALRDDTSGTTFLGFLS